MIVQHRPSPVSSSASAASASKRSARTSRSSPARTSKSTCGDQASRARRASGRPEHRRSAREAHRVPPRHEAGDHAYDEGRRARREGASLGPSRRRRNRAHRAQPDGKVPLHTLRADIDYAHVEAFTTFGRIGVKVWIYKRRSAAGSAARRTARSRAPSAAVPRAASRARRTRPRPRRDRARDRRAALDRSAMQPRPADGHRSTPSSTAHRRSRQPSPASRRVPHARSSRPSTVTASRPRPRQSKPRRSAPSTRGAAGGSEEECRNVMLTPKRVKWRKSAARSHDAARACAATR